MTRRQHVRPLCGREGTCYATTRRSMIEEARDVEEGCAAVVTERFVVDTYASKCHLCFLARTLFRGQGLYADEGRPEETYAS